MGMGNGPWKIDQEVDARPHPTQAAGGWREWGGFRIHSDTDSSHLSLICSLRGSRKIARKIDDASSVFM